MLSLNALYIQPLGCGQFCVSVLHLNIIIENNKINFDKK